MKITGIVVAFCGLVILLFSVFMAMQADTRSNNANSGIVSTERDITWPIVIGSAALVAGGLMVAVGGRGYFESAKLDVRN